MHADAAARREMADVLRESRALLALTENDYSWSSWEDAEAAVAEIDQLLAAVEGGGALRDLAGTVVFAPTGPMQEVSLSSGWGSAFLALADRWDAAAAAGAQALAGAAAECTCMRPAFDYRDFDRAELGVDPANGRFGDVSLQRCRHCGRAWLHYHYEVEAFSRSGRWYRGLLSEEQAARATADNALRVLAELPWHHYGGSWFETTGRRSDLPLDPGSA
jgi:hypothetical protein